VLSLGFLAQAGRDELGCELDTAGVPQRPLLVIDTDVAATALIRQRLIDLAGGGVAILVVSEDLGEILEVCDRVAVIAGGRLSPLREVSQSSADQIGRWMAGAFADAAPDAMTTVH